MRPAGRPSSSVCCSRSRRRRSLASSRAASASSDSRAPLSRSATVRAHCTCRIPRAGLMGAYSINRTPPLGGVAFITAAVSPVFSPPLPPLSFNSLLPSQLVPTFLASFTLTCLDELVFRRNSNRPKPSPPSSCASFCAYSLSLPSKLQHECFSTQNGRISSRAPVLTTSLTVAAACPRAPSLPLQQRPPRAKRRRPTP